MHALKVFSSPVWLLPHKLSSPHYRYIRKMRRDDRLPLTQELDYKLWVVRWRTALLLLVLGRSIVVTDNVGYYFMSEWNKPPDFSPFSFH